MLTLTTKGRRVAIAGQVIDATTQRPIAGARVELTTMPKPFRQRLQLKALQYGDRWEGLQERGDRTHTAPDGLFYFTNLPEGSYILIASFPKFGQGFGASGPGAESVERSEAINVQVPAVVSGIKPPFQLIKLRRLVTQPAAVHDPPSSGSPLPPEKLALKETAAPKATKSSAKTTSPKPVS